MSDECVYLLVHNHSTQQAMAMQMHVMNSMSRQHRCGSRSLKMFLRQGTQWKRAPPTEVAGGTGNHVFDVDDLEFTQPSCVRQFSNGWPLDRLIADLRAIPRCFTIVSHFCSWVAICGRWSSAQLLHRVLKKRLYPFS